jgi:hypothetical protein
MSIKLTKNSAQMVIILTPCQWQKRKIANRKQLQFALHKILAIFFSGHFFTPEEAS